MPTKNASKAVTVTVKADPMPQQKKQQKAKTGRSRQKENSDSSVPAASLTVLHNMFSVRPAPKKYGPGSICVKGQDYVTSAKFNTFDLQGTNNLNFFMNPGDGIFEGTRLQKYSNLYEKFLFLDFKIHAMPQVGTGVNGSYLLAYDRDVTDSTPPANQLGLKTYFGLMGTKSTNIFNRLTIDCPLSDTQDFYYCNQNVVGAEERLTYQGQGYVATVSPVSTACSVDIWLSYELVLWDPTVETQAIEAYTERAGSLTGSNASRAGFNNFAAALVQNPTGGIVMGQDGSGNTYFEVPSGSYLIDQVIRNIATGAQQINAPAIVANNPALQAQVLLTNLTSFTESVAGTSIQRTDNISIPPGGAKIWGNLLASLGYGRQFIRIIRGQKNWV